MGLSPWGLRYVFTLWGLGLRNTNINMIFCINEAYICRTKNITFIEWYWNVLEMATIFRISTIVDHWLNQGGVSLFIVFPPNMLSQQSEIHMDFINSKCKCIYKHTSLSHFLTLRVNSVYSLSHSAHPTLTQYMYRLTPLSVVGPSSQYATTQQMDQLILHRCLLELFLY